MTLNIQDKAEFKKEKVFVPTLRLLVKNFFDHNVGKNAAALAYYLLFALFPLLIFLSNLLGLLDLNVAAITQTLQQFMPKDVVGIIESYLEYVSQTSSHSLLWFALVFYTVVFLLIMGLTLLLSTLGKHVLGYINYLLPENAMRFSNYFLGIWQYLRFVPIGLLMFVALGTLYAVSLDRKQPAKALRPGIIFAMNAWLLVSVGFSFYVENFANYSVIYGTLGAVIVLLMWLYMTAVILIMGAELNATLIHIRSSEKVTAIENNGDNALCQKKD